jgi:hypothetical protein
MGCVYGSSIALQGAQVHFKAWPFSSWWWLWEERRRSSSLVCWARSWWPAACGTAGLVFELGFELGESAGN